MFAAATVLASPRIPLRGERRSAVSGGAGGDLEETAAWHSAPPDGGPGEEPGLGGTPSCRGRGARFQEGKQEVLHLNLGQGDRKQ